MCPYLQHTCTQHAAALGASIQLVLAVSLTCSESLRDQGLGWYWPKGNGHVWWWHWRKFMAEVRSQPAQC